MSPCFALEPQTLVLLQLNVNTLLLTSPYGSHSSVPDNHFCAVSRVSIFLHFIIYLFSHELAYIVNEYSSELRTSSSLSETLFSYHLLFFLFFFLLCYFLNLSFSSYGISLLSLPFKFSPICCCFILPAFSLLSLFLL